MARLEGEITFYITGRKILEESSGLLKTLMARLEGEMEQREREGNNHEEEVS